MRLVWTFCWINLYAVLAPCAVQGQCDAPLQFPHARHNGSELESFPEGVKIFYWCPYGFYRLGYPFSICKDTQWTMNEDIRCRRIFCPDVSPFPHGKVQRTPLGTGTYVWGTEVYFKCDEGATLIGDSRSTCTRSGSWSEPIPKCVVPCYIFEIPNGKMRSIEKNLPGPTRWYRKNERVEHGVSVTVVCDSRNFLAGDSNIACSDGHWSGNPSCISAKCEVPSMSNGYYVRYTRLATTKQQINPYFSIVPRCNKGYTADISALRRCLLGQWSGSSPTCHPSGCELPHDDGGSQIVFANSSAVPSSFKINHGSQFEVICSDDRDRTYPSASQRFAVCEYGEWNDDRPTCRHTPCILDFDYQNIHFEMDSGDRRLLGPGAVISSGQSVLAFECNEKERVISGKPRLACHKGKWSSEIPFCQPDMCPLNNTSRLVILDTDQANQHFVRSGESLRISCSTFPSAVTETFCIHGSWLPPLPRCGKDDCLLPIVSNGQYSQESDNKMVALFRRFARNISHGTRLRLSCDDRYKSTSREEIMCNDGHWTPALPQCITVATPPDNVPQKPTFDTCMVPEMKIGLLLNTDRIVMVSRNNVTNGTILTVVCPIGSRPAWEDRQVMCYKGSWDKYEPFCVKLPNIDDSGSCTSPVNDDNILLFQDDKQINKNAITRFPNDSLVYARCKEIGAYRFSGNTILKCIGSKWEGDTPMCEKSDPFKADGIPLIKFSVHVGRGSGSGGEYSIDDTGRLIVGSGSDVFIYCQHKYIRSFGGDRTYLMSTFMGNYTKRISISSIHECRQETIRCTSDNSGRRNFNMITFVSRAMKCPRIEQLPYMTLTFTNPLLTFGTMVTHACDDGYSLHGVHSRTCKHDGTWTADAPICTPTETRCSSAISQPSNGLVKSQGTVIGSKASLTCDTGYHPAHAIETICQEDGLWSDVTFRCQKETRCSSAISQPSNGLVKSQGTVIGSKASLTCDTGYHPAHDIEAICQEDGLWSDVTFRCQKETRCTSAISQPPNGLIKSIGTTIGSKASLTCDTGYHPANDIEAICQEDGLWSDVAFRCQKDVPCPAVTEPDNGSLEVVAIGQWIRFSCLRNYYRVGDHEIRCINGKWSSEPPTCTFYTVIPCPAVAEPDNGSFELAMNEHIKFIRFSCFKKYYRRGMHQIRCLNGKWSSEPPTCHLIGPWENPMW